MEKRRQAEIVGENWKPPEGFFEARRQFHEEQISGIQNESRVLSKKSVDFLLQAHRKELAKSDTEVLTELRKLPPENVANIVEMYHGKLWRDIF